METKIYRQITANNITLQKQDFLRELAMEAYLFENPDILKLDEDSFSEASIVDVEVPVKNGGRSRDGRIDILANYGGEYLGILELKKGEVDHKTLDQLKGYLKQREDLVGKSSEMGEAYWDHESGAEPKWIGILVGSSISEELKKEIMSGLKVDDIPIAGITINRFRGNHRDLFVISDVYFQFKHSTKDYSKFQFNGKKYNKGRLVHAVISEHVRLNENLTFTQLKKQFPNDIQGSLGVIETKEKAEDIFARWGHKRHYIKPDEIISLSDGEITTCTQWNPINIQRFIAKAREFRHIITDA